MKFNGLLNGEKWVFQNTQSNVQDGLVTDGEFITGFKGASNCSGIETLTRDFSFYMDVNLIKIPHEFHINSARRIYLVSNGINGLNNYDVTSNEFEIKPSRNRVW